MATLTIRDLDETVRDQLRVRAAQHGRSMEAEVREILRDAVARPPSPDRLGSRIHQRFAPSGGVDLEVPPRNQAQRDVPLQ